jgi:hypothetical protein
VSGANHEFNDIHPPECLGKIRKELVTYIAM